MVDTGSGADLARTEGELFAAVRQLEGALADEHAEWCRLRGIAPASPRRAD